MDSLFISFLTGSWTSEPFLFDSYITHKNFFEKPIETTITSFQETKYVDFFFTTEQNVIMFSQNCYFCQQNTISSYKLESNNFNVNK